MEDKNKESNKSLPPVGGEVGEVSHVSWKPGTLIYPLPAVLISCGNTPEEYNLLTISWVGTICTNPPMCYISVRPERHSYNIITVSYTHLRAHETDSYLV